MIYSKHIDFLDKHIHLRFAMKTKLKKAKQKSTLKKKMATAGRTAQAHVKRGRPFSKKPVTDFGKLIVDRNYSLQEVAEALGISPQYAGQLKQGQSDPSDRLRKKIAVWSQRKGHRISLKSWDKFRTRRDGAGRPSRGEMRS